MAGTWTEQEVEAAWQTYREMLVKELRGERYVKKQYWEDLQQRVNGRSRPSIEYKFHNISGVLEEENCPSIAGYVPRYNYQKLLREVVENRLRTDMELQQLFSEDAASPPNPDLPNNDDDILAAQVSPPKPVGVTAGRTSLKPPSVTPVLGINYIEREARNRAVGARGEEFVVRYEMARLRLAGQRTLAERIEHVSVTRGDGLGYDVLSYETSGEPRFIEVKATRYGSMTPFFLTRREVGASVEYAEQFRLYRVFELRWSPKFFELQGRIDQNCELEPIQYRARPR